MKKLGSILLCALLVLPLALLAAAIIAARRANRA